MSGDYEEFAAAAMQALLATYKPLNAALPSNKWGQLARDSFDIADVMYEELKRRRESRKAVRDRHTGTVSSMSPRGQR